MQKPKIRAGTLRDKLHCIYIYSLMYIYHISLFSKDAIDETFKSHPLHRKFHGLPLFFVLSEVVSCIHTHRQSEVCYFNHKIDVNPVSSACDRWGRGPIETGNSDAKHVIVHAQNDRSSLVPLETCYSGPKGAVLQAKATDEGGDP